MMQNKTRMVHFLNIVLRCIFLIFFIGNVVNAKSGCCSWHGGVCGNSCCDGSPLSATCGGSSYRTYYYSKCPSHSYEVNGGCKCEIGYKTNLFLNACEPDQNYHCYTKFPGTERDNMKKMCVCPDGDPMGWNPVERACPITDKQCQQEFGGGAIAYDFNHCLCGDGYERDDQLQKNRCVLIVSEQLSIKKEKASGLGFGGRFIIVILGLVVFFKVLR